MTSVVMNSADFFSGLDDFSDRFQFQFSVRIKRIMTAAMELLLAKTAVNSGQAARNYVASTGKPSSAAAKPGWKPVESTNDLALGAEALRGPAEAESMATLSGLDVTKPFKEFYITNKTPHIVDMEYGLVPAYPYTPRSQGMFRVTLQEIRAALESGRL